MGKILQRIQNQLQHPDVLDLLTQLPGADLNSLLLELFKRRAAALSPAVVLHDFGQNRFVAPSQLDTLHSRAFELEWLRAAAIAGFEPRTLSPVAPLGTCAVVGTVSQHKVLSATRGTEVVADATNVLALQIAQDFKHETDKQRVVHYATVHRHLRTQQWIDPGFTAHFSTFCLVSGGFDQGGFGFEMAQLNRHVALLVHLLGRSFGVERLSLKFLLSSPDATLLGRLQSPGQAWSHLPCTFVTDSDNGYYHPVQFKITVDLNGRAIDFADGGVVDWTQKMLSNRKHRLVISGAGTDLVQQLQSAPPPTDSPPTSV